MCGICSSTGPMILPGGIITGGPAGGASAVPVPVTQIGAQLDGGPVSPPISQEPVRLPDLVTTGKDWWWLPILVFGAVLLYAGSRS